MFVSARGGGERISPVYLVLVICYSFHKNQSFLIPDITTFSANLSSHLQILTFPSAAGLILLQGHQVYCRTFTAWQGRCPLHHCMLHFLLPLSSAPQPHTDTNEWCTPITPITPESCTTANIKR